MNTKDMTKGSPARLLVGFSLPLLAGNLFQQFYSMADSIIVGKGVGVGAFAAVGATLWVGFLILGFVTGLTGGFTILTAQCFGAGDAVGLRHTYTQGTILSVAISLVFTGASTACTMPLLKLLNTPEDILQDAYIYLFITFAGTLPTVMYNFYGSVLRALGNTKGPLYVLVISAIVNVVLDLIFVLPLKMGVAGAALATVIAQALSAVLCWALLRQYEILRTTREDWKLYLPMQKKLIVLGIPMALQNSIISIGGIIIQAFVNGYGSACVAGYSAASRIQGIVDQLGYTLGLAMATYSGQNLGARKMDRIRSGLRQSAWITAISSTVLGVLMVLFNRPVLLMFVDAAETETLAAAAQYLYILGPCEAILALLFLYRSALQGMGNTLVPMISGVVELGMRVAVAFIFSDLLNLGYFGVCMAEVGAWIGAVALLIPACYATITRKTREFSPKTAQ